MFSSPYFRFAAVVCVASGVFTVLGVPMLSFVGAVAAVVIPQYAVFSIISKNTAAGNSVETAQRAFYFWSLKFSTSILLMVVALRGLHESGLLQASSFIAGVIVAVVFNIFQAARLPLASRVARVKSANHGG